MKEYLISLIDKIQISLLLLIAFALPLFFLPYSFEIFEFPKTLLLISGSLILLLLWAVKSVVSQKLELLNTPLNLPVILFFAAYLLAALFSADGFVSVTGHYPRFYGSFVQVLALVIIFYYTISNISKEQVRLVLLSVLASAIVGSIMAMLSYFNFMPSIAGINQNFTPLSHFNNLAILIVFTLPIAIYFLIDVKKYAYAPIFAIAAIILFKALAIINFIPAWIILAAIILPLVLYFPQLSISKKQKYLLAVIAGAFIIISAVVYLPPVQKSILLPLANRDSAQAFLPKEPELSQRAGWSIVTKILSARPIFGSGPSTYPFAFTAARPAYLNVTNLWNLRFFKAPSEINRIFVESGIVGGLSFLLILAVLARFVIKQLFKLDFGNQTFFLTTAVFSEVISIFLFPFSVVHAFLFFLFTALLMVSAKDTGNIYLSKLNLFVLPVGKFMPLPKKIFTFEPLGVIFLVISAALVISGGLFLNQQIRAELVYKQALFAIQNNKAQDAEKFLNLAIAINPGRDIYHRTLASFHLAVAQNLARKGNLTDQEIQTLQILVSSAINQGKLITGFNIIRVPGTSTLNVLNWENLANSYAALIGVANGADQQAVVVFSQAIRLDPTNILLWLNLGNVYARVGNFDEAIKAYERVAALKPDYALGHYNLALALKSKGGQEVRVAQELANTLQIIPVDSKDRERVQKELEEAQIKVQELQKQKSTQQPAGQQQTATPSAR